MACWYPKIKSTKIFDDEYAILFEGSPLLVPHINNRSLLLNFRMARRYPKIFVHESYKLESCRHKNFPVYDICLTAELRHNAVNSVEMVEKSVTCLCICTVQDTQWLKVTKCASSSPTCNWNIFSL